MDHNNTETFHLFDPLVSRKSAKKSDKRKNGFVVRLISSCYCAPSSSSPCSPCSVIFLSLLLLVTFATFADLARASAGGARVSGLSSFINYTESGDLSSELVLGSDLSSGVARLSDKKYYNQRWTIDQLVHGHFNATSSRDDDVHICKYINCTSLLYIFRYICIQTRQRRAYL